MHVRPARCACAWRQLNIFNMPWVQSEYAPVHQERRRYISNFTGSAGTALITETRALLWTDGRYFLQVRAVQATGQCRRACSKHGSAVQSSPEGDLL